MVASKTTTTFIAFIPIIDDRTSPIERRLLGEVSLPPVALGFGCLAIFRFNLLRFGTGIYYLQLNQQSNARINAAGSIERSIQFLRMTSKLISLALNELLCRPVI